MKKFSKPFFEKKRRILSDNKEWVSGRVGRRSRQPRAVGNWGPGHSWAKSQKQASKNSWNRRITLVPATVWKILNVKRQKSLETRLKKFVKSTLHTCACIGLTNFEFEAPKIAKKRRKLETEVIWICRNYHGKTREITLGELMFWRIFWHYEPLCREGNGPP